MAKRGPLVVQLKVEWSAAGATLQDGVELGIARQVAEFGPLDEEGKARVEHHVPVIARTASKGLCVHLAPLSQSMVGHLVTSGPRRNAQYRLTSVLACCAPRLGMALGARPSPLDEVS